MPRVIVIGGGLAGLSAAAALGGAGFRVEVFEARPFLGGRATSFPLTPADEASETIDNCQHILLRCCVNLLDFYRRLGVRDRIRFYREFYFIEPGGRVSVLRRGALPAPLHFAGSFLRLRFLDAADKMAIARGLLALRRERTRRQDLDRISMLDWLLRKAPDAARHRPLLAPGAGQRDQRGSGPHGRAARLPGASGWGSWRAPMPTRWACPRCRWRNFTERTLWQRLAIVRLQLRAPVEAHRRGRRLWSAGAAAHGRLLYFRAAVRAAAGARACPAPAFEHSPITGDSPLVRPRHHAICRTPRCSTAPCSGCSTRSAGRYLQLVVSASRAL